MSFVQKLLLIIIRCLEDANDHTITIHKFSLSIMVSILIGCAVLPDNLFELIEHRDPMTCVAYQNIVFSLGINDIRLHNIKSKRDIEKVFNRFRSKIREITQLNSNDKIFIFPVLPTGSEFLNLKVIDYKYNRLLIKDLTHSFYNVSIVQGVPRFLDEHRNILKSSLLKKQEDILHINSNVHGLLVRLIIMKDVIYSRKKGFVDGRRYSNSVKSGNSGKTLTCQVNHNEGRHLLQEKRFCGW